MKPWQLGFDLDKLKGLSRPFERAFKPHIYGAFGMPKERDIALALSEGRLVWRGDPPEAAMIYRRYHRKTTQRDFSKRKVQFLPGDTCVQHIAGPAKLMRSMISELGDGGPMWVETFEECTPTRDMVRDLGFKKVATKVMASSEIKGLWLRSDAPTRRVSRPVARADRAALALLSGAFCSRKLLGEVRDELTAYAPIWEQHYSSYNKRQSWTAIALKGFMRGDPSFIMKPSEMSKGWKSSHPEMLVAKCGWTPAAAAMPAARALAETLPCEAERVRFMRLRAADGELTRHADITDRDAGTRDGDICRLHIPIITAPGCCFSSWDLDGNRIERQFSAGSLFYLDIRKPHAVVNSSPVDRVHMVIDLFCNAQLRAMLAA